MATSMQKRVRRIYVSIRLDGHSVSATLDTKTQAKTWASTVRRAIMEARALHVPFDAAAHKIKRPRKAKADPAAGAIGLFVDVPVEMTQEEIDRDRTSRADWTVARALRHWTTPRLTSWPGAFRSQPSSRCGRRPSSRKNAWLT